MPRPIYLPNLSIVIIDCVAHDLTRLALRDTLKCIEPKTVLIYSDDGPKIAKDLNLQSCHYYPFLAKSTQEVAVPLWFNLASDLYTSHALHIQYDSWALNSWAWKYDFLSYDYIGAPWPWHQAYKVGNGGFSIRSKRLIDRVAQEMLVETPEDDWLCRRARPDLERQSFTWAPESIARLFSFERDLPHRTFGFHGIFNWPFVLDNPGLQERKSLANEYVKGKIEWQEMLQNERQLSGNTNERAGDEDNSAGD